MPAAGQSPFHGILGGGTRAGHETRIGSPLRRACCLRQIKLLQRSIFMMNLLSTV